MFYIDWFQSSYTTEQPQKIGRETTVVETIECTAYVCGWLFESTNVICWILRDGSNIWPWINAYKYKFVLGGWTSID